MYDVPVVRSYHAMIFFLNEVSSFQENLMSFKVELRNGKNHSALSLLFVATLRALFRKIRSFLFPQEVTSREDVFIPPLDKSLAIFSLMVKEEEDHWSLVCFHHSQYFPGISGNHLPRPGHSLLVSVYSKS